MKPKIGILGGLGPESSAEFYKRLILRVQESGIKSNEDYPHIIIESIPAPEAVNNEDLQMYKDAIINLERAGADFIVIVCNTAHIFINEFQELVKIPIIDLREEVEKYLIEREVEDIIILGSRKSIKRLFRFEKLRKRNINDEESKRVDELILNYNAGVNKEVQKEELLEIVKKYSNTKILAGCTEISMMLKDSGIDYFDTFYILLNATFSKWDC